MPGDALDRRRAVRIVPRHTQALSRIRLRTGRDLAVINVSPLGALVEGQTRLLPGTHVDVHVTGAQGRILVRARVVRSQVWALDADTVHYRGGLAFEVTVDLGQVEAEDRPSRRHGTDTQSAQPVHHAIA